MDLSAVTKLPPKRLAIVAVVGVGGGLLWRRHNAKKAGTTTADAGSAPNDVAPIYAQGAANDLIGSSSAARDVGQGTINLPITKSIITVGGVDYYVDANGNTTPVNATAGPASSVPLAHFDLPTQSYMPGLPANVNQQTGVWNKTGVPPGISVEPTVAYGNGGIGYDAHGNPTTLNNGLTPWL